MFITANQPQPPGSILDFEFQLGDGFEIIRGKGEVVWTRAVAEGPGRPAGMGIRFLELSDGSKELIYRIVDQYIQDGGDAFRRVAAAAGPAADARSGHPPAGPLPGDALIPAVLPVDPSRRHLELAAAGAARGR